LTLYLQTGIVDRCGVTSRVIRDKQNVAILKTTFEMKRTIKSLADFFAYRLIAKSKNPSNEGVHHRRVVRFSFCLNTQGLKEI